MAVAVRRPADCYVRIPDVAVVAFIAPVSVIVQVVVADDVGRDIASGTRILPAVIAVVGPVIELVGIADLFHVGFEGIGAAESGSLSGVDFVGLSVASGFAVSFADRDDSVAAVFAGFHAITSGLVNGERQIRRVDLKGFVTIQPAHANIDGAGAQLNLRRAVVEVEERDAGIFRQANHGRSKLQFSARAAIGPDLVASGHRPVINGADPILFTSGLE